MTPEESKKLQDQMIPPKMEFDTRYYYANEFGPNSISYGYTWTPEPTLQPFGCSEEENKALVEAIESAKNEIIAESLFNNEQL